MEADLISILHIAGSNGMPCPDPHGGHFELLP